MTEMATKMLTSQGEVTVDVKKTGETAQIGEWKAYEGSVKVPEREYFVLGDNSPESLDSRQFRTVPAEALLGRVFAVAWPPSRMRTVR